MLGLVLANDSGDQDESGVGLALEDPGSDGRTDTLMGRGVPRWGSTGESFLALLGQERVSEGGDIGSGSWRGRSTKQRRRACWRMFPHKRGKQSMREYYSV